MCLQRRLWIATACTLALSSCAEDQPSYGAGSGELGKGSLSIVCAEGDAACSPSDATLAASTPVAVTASFGLTYEGRIPNAPTGEPTTMILFSASPALLSVTDGEFIAWAPGSVAVLARTAEGTVTDFVHLKLEPIARVELVGPATLRVGEQNTYTATPRSRDDEVLAGVVGFGWQVEGTAVSIIQSAQRVATISAVESGIATLRVTGGDAKAEAVITVEAP